MECQVFGDVMLEFYQENHFVSGGTPGGQFTGRVLREIMSPEKLQLLSQKLGDSGDIYIQYLASMRELYSHCIQKRFNNGSYVEKAAVFKECFERVHNHCGLSETVKVYLLILVGLGCNLTQCRYIFLATTAVNGLPGMDTPWDCSWTRALRHPTARSVIWREPTLTSARECLLGRKRHGEVEEA